MLGAVPFPTDVPLLKELGVAGVVTLNEPYETLVPSSLYQVSIIFHAVIRTENVERIGKIYCVSTWNAFFDCL